jgi:hypothetical protein
MKDGKEAKVTYLLTTNKQVFSEIAKNEHNNEIPKRQN